MGEWKRDTNVVYEIDPAIPGRVKTLWSFTVKPEQRVSVNECAAIARLAQSAPTLRGAIVQALTVIKEDDPSGLHRVLSDALKAADGE